jgi:alpha-tubulin suppressor-like RCC1 family protein
VSHVSGNIYRLTWASGKMFNGGDITISVASIQDQLGNTTISSNTHTGGAIATISTPSGLALVTPATSPSTDTTPTVQVSGVTSGDTVAIYTDSNCALPSLKASATSSGATIDLTSSALSDASYTFYANTTDTAGNISTCSTANVAYVVDTTDPTLSLTSFNGGISVYKGSSQSITWTGSDSNFGATPIAIDYSADGGSSWTSVTTGTANTGSYNWTIPTIASTTTAKLRLIAVDQAGNSTPTTSSSTFKISGTPTQINVTGSASVIAGTCNSYTILIKDASNGLAYVSSALPISLSSGGWGTFYSDSACTASITTKTVALTNSSTIFYYKSNLINASVTLTASESTIPLSDGTISVAITPAAASQLSFTTQPSTTATSGTNFAAQPAVTLKDAFGNTITAVTPTVNLTAFTDSSCRTFASGTLTASATAPSSGVATFSGVQYSQADTIYLKGSASGTTSACSDAITVSSTPTQLAITGTNLVSSSQCSAPLIVTAKDANGNPANVASNQTIGLSSTLSGTLYSDSGCSSSIPSVQINSGTSSATFYFKDAVQESPTLTASLGGLTDGTFVMKVQDITQLSGTTNRVCSIVNGGAYCWGDNSSGSLGNNVAGSPVSPVPSQVLGLTSGVTRIHTSSNTTCAVVSGAAYCWGSNSGGQIGDNSTTPRSAPTQVYGLTSGVTEIATSSNNSCAIVNGAVQCWGNNSSGELGINSTGGSSNIPVQVTGLTSGATSVAVGGNFACAVVNGAALCWGNGANGALGNNAVTPSNVPVQVTGLTSGVTSVVSGGGNTCALLSTGAVKCWGGGLYGILGYNGTAAKTTPFQVTGLTSGVTALSGGGSNYCAIQSGAVYCWGNNFYGQVGNGSFTTSNLGVGIPNQVSGLSSGATLVASGNQSCAVQNGKLVCWGYQASGNIGVNTWDYHLTPSLVAGMTTATQLSSSSVGSVFSALLSDSSLLSWGDNQYGGIGIGTTTTYELPTQTTGMTTGVTALASGNASGCAIVNGSLSCWGLNNSGQLGDNTGGNRSSPTQVVGLTSDVTQVGMGVTSSCAVVNGGVQCWGQNSNGQLGDNSNTNSLTAVQVFGLTSGATQVSAGNLYACALVSGGAKCWGNGANGRLGNNAASDSWSPVQVYGLTSGVTQISAGYRHACAVVNGAAQCWGTGTTGALGNNSTAQSNIPVQVFGLTSGVTQVAAGNDSTCALVSGGVKCWGTNTKGQLGNNSLTQSNIPVQVKYLTAGVVSLGASSTAYCAAMDNGSVHCWGNNVAGQLGSSPYQFTPAFVGPWP